MRSLSTGSALLSAIRAASLRSLSEDSPFSTIGMAMHVASVLAPRLWAAHSTQLFKWDATAVAFGYQETSDALTVETIFLMPDGRERGQLLIESLPLSGCRLSQLMREKWKDNQLTYDWSRRDWSGIPSAKSAWKLAEGRGLVRAFTVWTSQEILKQVRMGKRELLSVGSRRGRFPG